MIIFNRKQHNTALLVRMLVYMLILPLLLISCEREKTIDFPVNYTPNLIITGFVSTNFGIKALVTLSQDPYSTDDVTLPDIKVFVVSEHNDTIWLQKSTDGLFTSNCLIDSNTSYQIFAIANGFSAVSSPEIFVPSRIKILESMLIERDNNYLVKMRFQPGDGKYFALKTITHFANGAIKTDKDLLFMPGSVFQPVDLDNEGNIWCERPYDKDYGEGDSIIIATSVDAILYHVDESTYRFFNSLDESDFTSGDMMLDPTVIYSNIKNGYGVFGGFSSDTIHIPIR
jgi:hypothetical protein